MNVEDQEFKVILSYFMSLKLAWTARLTWTTRESATEKAIIAHTMFLHLWKFPSYVHVHFFLVLLLLFLIKYVPYPQRQSDARLVF